MLLDGERVTHLRHPSWGTGEVLEDSSQESARVFFEYLGRAEVDLSDLRVIETAGASHPILDALLSSRSRGRRARHNIYVVLLDSEVLNHGKFLRANPEFRGSRPCVYVGMTGLDPADRFQNHKRGYRSNSYVRRYGKRLMPEFFENFNPLPYRVAQVIEVEYAQHLRSSGFAVWQH
ncbi:MAG: DUF3553 domain-containing protein [Acidobacteriota bacterium]|nr:MAG: DUF3553 domain-containing protein [Acidobacteriota bacterium]